jgi:hypothetical protein
VTPSFVVPRLWAESAGVVRQALLDIWLALQAHVHQALDVLLGLRPMRRVQKRAPFGADLDVGRQGRDIDQALDGGDGLLSNLAIRRASLSTNWSSSASGSARLT